MAVWDELVEYMSTGIFGGNAGAIIMSAFIIGLCIYGLIKSRKIFKEV